MDSSNPVWVKGFFPTVTNQPGPWATGKSVVNTCLSGCSQVNCGFVPPVHWKGQTKLECCFTIFFKGERYCTLRFHGPSFVMFEYVGSPFLQTCKWMLSLVKAKEWADRSVLEGVWMRARACSSSWPLLPFLQTADVLFISVGGTRLSLSHSADLTSAASLKQSDRNRWGRVAGCLVAWTGPAL